MRWVLDNGKRADLETAVRDDGDIYLRPAQFGNLDMLKFLFERDVMADPVPVLQTAVAYGHLHIFEWLHDVKGVTDAAGGFVLGHFTKYGVIWKHFTFPTFSDKIRSPPCDPTIDSWRYKTIANEVYKCEVSVASGIGHVMTYASASSAAQRWFTGREPLKITGRTSTRSAASDGKPEWRKTRGAAEVTKIDGKRATRDLRRTFHRVMVGDLRSGSFLERPTGDSSDVGSRWPVYVPDPRTKIAIQDPDPDPDQGPDRDPDPGPDPRFTSTWDAQAQQVDGYAMGGCESFK
ncbi:hypothetical protein PHYPSEUDO_007613 [Phytophthora pseudosyringae]|uniref:Ankyrin repeat protein n=1 Tax=Phytophthora pseudosyringae TaxID=221518 RepID=A0A8T1VFZ6_9STRA|nr:hypothetical protein PHYPSEUDO_007613 [Phytophthora pseudosyringae]